MEPREAGQPPAREQRLWRLAFCLLCWRFPNAFPVSRVYWWRYAQNPHCSHRLSLIFITQNWSAFPLSGSEILEGPGCALHSMLCFTPGRPKAAGVLMDCCLSTDTGWNPGLLLLGRACLPALP